MPKLSETTLSKRFACLYCGESFRTRQGLSGHIRFKHQISQLIPQVSSGAFMQQNSDETVEQNWADLTLESKKLKELLLIAKYSEEESQAFALILARWIFVKNRAKLYYKVDVSPQDFRAYVLSSIARWFQLQDFKKELDTMFEKHVNQILQAINNAIK